MNKPSILPVPHTTEGDPNALEIARIWTAHGRQHVLIRTGIWDDPAAWGIMLVDFARHVANAYEADGRADYFEVLAKIREMFDAEWDSPTDIATGQLSSDPPPDEPIS
jgi:Domain of unknown function (DUF5076)